MVDAVNSSTSAASQTQSQKASATADVNFDTFLQLLTVQLQNQDPLNPMEGTAFTEQLATFSGLEQQIQTNSHLEKMVSGDNYSQQALAISTIGKVVMAEGNALNIAEDGGDVSFKVALEEPTVSTTVEIVNSEGVVIRTLKGDEVGTDEGANDVTWDGEDDLGNEMPAGQYTIRVSAMGGDGKKVLNSTYVYDEVTGAEAIGGELMLTLSNGGKVSFNDILSVNQKGSV